MSEEISLDKLAQDFFTNKFLLCKAYKQQTGIGIWEDLLQIRMERAAALLENTNQKIYTIGAYVGYQDGSYFSLVFKKHFGLSPKEYRESHMQKK